MTLYRKYRPQKIEEIDLTEIRETLQKIARNADIPHAFLFAGPRGAGKTSAARILAKVVNCDPPSPRLRKGIEPCNKCEQCTAIAKGISLSVIEIDAASHRGIDDIRVLRETVKLSPAGGRMKVYIIDEAHMLTTEASNALLKTLEEPPSHAIFILATTAPEKLPDTTRSRCMTLVFRKGREDEVIRSLERAVKGEGIKIEKDALSEIAKNTDGSFREAHKILEQLALGGEKITWEAAKRLFELASANPQKLLSHIAGKDTKGALEEIEKVVEKGANLKLYTAEIIRILRLSLLGKVGVETKGAAILELEIEETKTLIELFSEAARQLPTAVIPQLPLELAVVKWGEGGEEQVQSARLDINSPPAEGGTGPARSRSRGPRPAGLSTLDSTSQGLAQTVGPNARGHAPVPGKELEESWREIMRQVKQKNHSAEALLRATRPRKLEAGVLEIEVFYQFHKERIEKEPYRSLVEGVAAEVFSGNIRLLCSLSSSGQKAVDLVNVTEDVEEDITRLAEEIFSEKSENKRPN